MNGKRFFATLIASVWLPSSCKIATENVRSDARNAEVYKLIEKDSFKFVRSPEGSSGEFSFKMKDRHHCRVEYWSADPTGRPPPSSPVVLNCPTEVVDNAVNFQIKNIVAGIPLTFRIHVWPRTLNFRSSLSIVWQERPNLDATLINSMIVSRFVSPRNSNEIYTYKFPKATSLGEVSRAFGFKGTPGKESCTLNYRDVEPPYPRYKSIEDPQKRYLHGLGADVTSSGYATGAATGHPLFLTRLRQVYKNVDRLQQNWKWNFTWEKKRYSFDTLTPGYMSSVELIKGDQRVPIQNRALGKALVSSVDVSDEILSLNPTVLSNTDIGVYHFTLQTTDASKTALRCDFPADQRSLSIPAEYLKKIGAGEYLATLALDTVQIHYKEGAEYPPWVISAQDWVYFKVSKK